MKKIFFLTGVALCALTLATSCVKDNESASVTSLRNAKTEQIKAAAELAKAQAAAATLTAQADANLKNAQAELAKAQAELANAQTEAAKAQAQYQIQSILNQMELDQIQFEYDMAKLVADLEKDTAQIEKDKADAAIAELELAATNYKNAVNSLINAQSQLNTLKTSLARNEVSQANWENSKAEDIADYKHTIAQEQAKIEVYKQYANYTGDIDALHDKHNVLKLKSQKLWEDYNAILDKINYAQTNLTDEGEKAAYKKLEENLFWQVFLNDGAIILSDGETVVPVGDTKATWLARPYSYDSKEVTIYSYTHKDGNESKDSRFYEVRESNANVSHGGVSGKIDEVSADFINMLIKEDKANYAKEKKNLDAALKALNDELKPLKDTAAAKLAALNAIEVGAEGYNAAKTAYEAAVKAVNDKQGEIDQMNDDIKTAANNSEAYDIIAGFVVNYAENCKTVADLYDAVGEGIASDHKEYGDLNVAKCKAKEEAEAVQPELDAIGIVLYGGNAYGAEVLASWIEESENTIKTKQAQIDNYDLNHTSYEQAIEAQKKNIALQEEYIKSLEVIANQRKAEYEAVLAKYQNAE